jgi:hypothetical protein
MDPQPLYDAMDSIITNGIILTGIGAIVAGAYFIVKSNSRVVQAIIDHQLPRDEDFMFRACKIPTWERDEVVNEHVHKIREQYEDGDFCWEVGKVSLPQGEATKYRVISIVHLWSPVKPSQREEYSWRRAIIMELVKEYESGLESRVNP